MDRPRASVLVAGDREDHGARLPHPQDAADQRWIEVCRDAGIAAVGEHEVDADGARAGLRGHL